MSDDSDDFFSSGDSFGAAFCELLAIAFCDDFCDDFITVSGGDGGGERNAFCNVCADSVVMFAVLLSGRESCWCIME